MMKSPVPLFDNLTAILKKEAYIPTLPATLKPDFDVALQFLQSYRGSEATFNAYRREIERLLQWCWWVANTTLNQLNRLHIEHFIEFCQAPPANWLGNKQTPRFVLLHGCRQPNPEWRPFVIQSSDPTLLTDSKRLQNQYRLSQKTLQALFAILGSFFNYLVEEDYLKANPVAQLRQKSKYLRKPQVSRGIVRRLSELQWAYVIETAEMMAAAEPAVHERTLFIMNILYSLYLRISELAASKRWEPQMGHFHRDQDGNWWFLTVGKGNKERIIAVSDAMLLALQRYRRFLKLSPLPAPGETTPLLMKTRGRGAISSTRQIRYIVQHCFDQAIARLRQDGFTEDAEQLSAATVHWLRHTGISEDVKHRPREHVRDDAGHSSSAITDRYIDVELRARHLSARNKRIKD